MAKMHTRKRGRSGSKKPASRQTPEWVDYSAQEVEEVVIKLHTQGISTAIIGQTLRDNYGVPSVQIICGKPITKIIKESGAKREYPDDLLNLIKRATKIRKHLGKNKQDKRNITGLNRVESKIRRLVGYYSLTGDIPKGWKYEPEKAALLVK